MPRQDQVTRRSFLAASVGSMVALSSSNASLGLSNEDETELKIDAEGFDKSEQELLGGSLWWLNKVLLSKEVSQKLLLAERPALLKFLYVDRAGLIKEGGGVDSSDLPMLLPIQLKCLRDNGVPKVHLIGYEADDGVMGYAKTNHNVQIDDDGNFKGEFEVFLNRTQIAKNADAVIWAGTIAHEMLHNLGHLHYKDEYSDKYQINYFTSLIWSAENHQVPGRDKFVFKCGAPAGSKKQEK